MAPDARQLPWPLVSAVLACGGTGGHVYPAIAIARELAGRHPDARLSFIGRPASFEAEAIAREGFEMDALEVGRLAGQGLLRRLRTALCLPLAVLRASRLLGRRRPQVVIGTGGFVSGPTMLAAVLRRIPTVVQEQNAVPGMTNWVLWNLVRRVALAHAQSGAAAPKFVVTGNPVRREFFAVAPWEAREPFTLLVLGGSQGARALNDTALAAAELLGDLAGRVRFVLQCGRRWEDAARARAAACPIAVEVHGYLHDMPGRLEQASLVACRSGASTVAEICAAGRPSLLVPFPHAAGDHQALNAAVLGREGAADVVREADLSPQWLAAHVRAAVNDQARLGRLAVAARALARHDATLRIADLVEEAAGCRRAGRAA